MLNKKGSVGLYCLVILTVVLFYSSLLMISIRKYIYFRENLEVFRRLNNAECLAILRVKREFRDYKEKDESLRYEGCTIDISYQSTKATITIVYKGSIRERELEFDEVSETLKEYK